MRPDIPLEIVNLLRSGKHNFDTYWRLTVANGSGTPIDLSSRIITGSWTPPNPNNTVGTVALQLLRDREHDPLTSLSPEITASLLNKLDDGVTYSPLLKSGRQHDLSVAIVPRGAGRPSDPDDYYGAHTGRIYNVDWAGEYGEVGVTFYDYAGILQRTWTENPGFYPAGTLLEDVIQGVIDNEFGPGTFPLVVPVPSGYVIDADFQPDGLVWPVITELASKRGGWLLYLRYDAAGNPYITFFEPERSKNVADVVHNIVYENTQIEINDDQIRTVVEGYAYTPQGLELHDKVENPIKTAEWGGIRRFMRLVEQVGSVINSVPALNTYISAALSDTEDPDKSMSVRIPFFLPLEIGIDRYEFAPLNRIFDTPQLLAPFEATHEIIGGGKSGDTIMDLRGRPSAGASTWIAREQPARTEEPIEDLLVLRNFREVELSSEEWKHSWENGDGVYQTWVYINTFAKPLPEDPWPTNEPDRQPDYILDAGVEEFIVPVPPEGNKSYVQYEPRDNSIPPRAGEIRRATVEGLPGVSPVIAYINQTPATTPEPAKTDLVVVVADPQLRPGRLYAWVNHASVDAANPALAADGYVDITLDTGSTSVDAFTVFNLTAGGTANLFQNLTLHAQYGKRVWVKFVAEDGAATDQVDRLLHTWHQIIVGASGDWVPEIITEAALGLSIVDTAHLKLGAVERQNIVDGAINAAKTDIISLSDLTTDIGNVFTGRLDNLPASAFIDLEATGTGIVIGHPNFALYGNGDAVFSGDLSAATGTFNGTVMATAILAGGLVLQSLSDDELTQAEVTRIVVDGGIIADKLSVSTLSEITDDVGIVVSGELRNSAGTRYINLDATGTQPFIHASGALSILADGTATFSGNVTATATITGRIVVAGNLGTDAVDVSTTIADGVVTALKISVTTLSEIIDDLGVIISGVLRNSGNTQGIRIDSSDTLPGGWTSYLDLGAAGANPILKTPNVSINADGSVDFGTQFTLDSSGNAYFAGELTAEDVVLSGGGRFVMRPDDGFGLGYLEWEDSFGDSYATVAISSAGLDTSLEVTCQGFRVTAVGIIELNPSSYLRLLNLPTTNPGGTNRVWRNGNVLNIT